jgi:hypothetical protein
MEKASIGEGVQVKHITVVQYIAASPLSWCDRPKLGYQMYAPLNVTHRYNTTYPIAIRILLQVCFEHSMIWFGLGQL